MRIHQFYGGLLHGRNAQVQGREPVLKFAYEGREDSYKLIEHHHWDGSIELIYVCIGRETVVQ